VAIAVYWYRPDTEVTYTIVTVSLFVAAALYIRAGGKKDKD